MREEAITSIAVIAGVMEKAGRGQALQSYQQMTDDGHRKIMKQDLGNEAPGNVLFASTTCRIFVQYYDSIMPMLKQFVMTATSKKVRDALMAKYSVAGA